MFVYRDDYPRNSDLKLGSIISKHGLAQSDGTPTTVQWSRFDNYADTVTTNNRGQLNTGPRIIHQTPIAQPLFKAQIELSRLWNIILSICQQLSSWNAINFVLPEPFIINAKMKWRGDGERCILGLNIDIGVTPSNFSVTIRKDKTAKIIRHQKVGLAVGSIVALFLYAPIVDKARGEVILEKCQLVFSS